MHALVLLVLLADGGADGGVAPGDYYAVRVTRTRGGGAMGDGVVTTSWRPDCQLVIVDHETVRLEEFTMSIRKDGSIGDPRFTSRRRPTLVMDGTCRLRALPDGLFADRQSCEQSITQSRFTRTCDGGTCEWSQRPWLLDGCEEELARIRNHGGYLLQTTHEEALKTLERFMKVVKNGGTLWSMGSCAPFRISPRDREGRSKLSEVSPAGTYEADGYLEPLFGQASFSMESGSFDGGGWAETMSHRRIYLGREFVTFGDRMLVFDKSKCTP